MTDLSKSYNGISVSALIEPEITMLRHINKIALDYIEIDVDQKEDEIEIDAELGLAIGDYRAVVHKALAVHAVADAGLVITSFKTTGTTMRVSKVATRSPPITAMASGALRSAPRPMPRAMGVRPRTVVTVVMTMGLRRTRPASRMASRRARPWSRA